MPEHLENEVSHLKRRVDTLERFEKEHLDLHRAMMEQFKPISEVFSNVNSFRNVSIVLLKGVILLGAAIGMVYSLIKYLK